MSSEAKKTVVVVSNNNSATRNVAKKLEKKNAAFLTAFFDSLTNKEKLLDAQMPIRIFLSCASVQTAVEKKRKSEMR